MAEIITASKGWDSQTQKPMDVQTILDRTFFVLILKARDRSSRPKEVECFALHLEEALERTGIDRSQLTDAYMQVEEGFFPVFSAGKAIGLGVMS